MDSNSLIYLRDIDEDWTIWGLKGRSNAGSMDMPLFPQKKMGANTKKV